MSRSLLEATDDEIWRALNMYNNPAGNGVPKTTAIGQRYRDGLELARQLVAERGGSPEPEPDAGYTPAIHDRPGYIGGRFTRMPRGVVLHGSRSTRRQSIADEFRGTANWAQTNPGGLGWNVTVGDDEIAIHLGPDQWGHHARAASDEYLSVEFAQPLEEYDITDGQVRAFVWWLTEVVLPRWPGLPLHFPTHAELDGNETGAFDGKTDVFSKGSPRADELRGRIMALLVEDQPEVDVTREEAEQLRAENARLAGERDQLAAIAEDRQRRIESQANLIGNAYNRDGPVYQALLKANRPRKTHKERTAEVRGVLAFLDANRPQPAA